MAKHKFAPVAALFETDAYKLGHIAMQTQGLRRVYSNFTNRGSRIPGITHTVAFALQACLQKQLMDAYVPFFEASEDEVAALYEERLEQILGPNTIGSDHIRALHRKGYLPLRFCSVKEGTLVPFQVPTLIVENTDPDFAWLTNYVETIISSSIWHPATSATKDVQVRGLIEAWAERTGANKDLIDWQWHDFSFRGQTSPESAAASGAAHLLSFKGTDNLNAFDWIDEYYPGDNGFLGGSVSASEHSIMVEDGREHEQETYARLMRAVPTGILSLVSDTWDLWNVVEHILPALHEQIMARDGKLVIRPDSGVPEDILCGTVREFGVGTTAEEKGLVELLWEQFGGTENTKGYKSLDSHIGAIYGDSITLDRANEIFDRLAAKGFASDNMVFGAGSWHYQGVSRDTFNSAIKATWIQVNDEGRDVMKDPITAKGSKKSATGRLAVLKDEQGELVLVQHATPEQEAASELQVVWEDGKFVRTQSFADVRATLEANRNRF